MKKRRYGVHKSSKAAREHSKAPGVKKAIRAIEKMPEVAKIDLGPTRFGSRGRNQRTFKMLEFDDLRVELLLFGLGAAQCLTLSLRSQKGLPGVISGIQETGFDWR